MISLSSPCLGFTNEEPCCDHYWVEESTRDTMISMVILVMFFRAMMSMNRVCV